MLTNLKEDCAKTDGKPNDGSLLPKSHYSLIVKATEYAQIKLIKIFFRLPH